MLSRYPWAPSPSFPLFLIFFYCLLLLYLWFFLLYYYLITYFKLKCYNRFDVSNAMSYCRMGILWLHLAHQFHQCQAHLLCLHRRFLFSGRHILLTSFHMANIYLHFICHHYTSLWAIMGFLHSLQLGMYICHQPPLESNSLFHSSSQGPMLEIQLILGFSLPVHLLLLLLVTLNRFHLEALWVMKI